MTSQGQVRVWHDREGWGVIDSETTPGGCWAHHSSVLVAGYKTLETGTAVTLSFEAAYQDGYSFRAVEVWPTGQKPVRDHHEVSGPATTYHSTLAIRFDGDGDGDGDGEVEVEVRVP